MRLTETLDAEVGRYLEQNGVNFNQLCAFALEKFIRKPQVVELPPVGAESKMEPQLVGRAGIGAHPQNPTVCDS